VERKCLAVIDVTLYLRPVCEKREEVLRKAMLKRRGIERKVLLERGV
jgi:hypothetical protein